jgi:hypothetical protein
MIARFAMTTIDNRQTATRPVLHIRYNMPRVARRVPDSTTDNGAMESEVAS